MIPASRTQARIEEIEAGMLPSMASPLGRSSSFEVHQVRASSDTEQAIFFMLAPDHRWVLSSKTVGVALTYEALER
jgi:hypothetical protein